MTSRDFCYWLQGFMELQDPQGLTTAQVQAVKNHLAMVFKHEIDPSNGDKKHNDELAELHRRTFFDPECKLNC